MIGSQSNIQNVEQSRSESIIKKIQEIQERPDHPVLIEVERILCQAFETEVLEADHVEEEAAGIQDIHHVEEEAAGIQDIHHVEEEDAGKTSLILEGIDPGMYDIFRPQTLRSDLYLEPVDYTNSDRRTTKKRKISTEAESGPATNSIRNMQEFQSSLTKYLGWVSFC